jgi:hypothetical protein
MGLFFCRSRALCFLVLILPGRKLMAVNAMPSLGAYWWCLPLCSRQGARHGHLRTRTAQLRFMSHRRSSIRRDLRPSSTSKRWQHSRDPLRALRCVRNAAEFGDRLFRTVAEPLRKRLVQIAPRPEHNEWSGRRCEPPREPPLRATAMARLLRGEGAANAITRQTSEGTAAAAIANTDWALQPVPRKMPLRAKAIAGHKASHALARSSLRLPFQ